MAEEGKTTMVEVDPQVGDLEETTITGVEITPIIIVLIGTITTGITTKIKKIQS